MAVDAAGLLDMLRRADGLLEQRYVLVAAGGTAMTFYGLKEYTKDVDFIVASGDIPVLKKTFGVVTDARVDLFDPAMVLFTQLPPDYVSKSGKYASLNNIDVYVLSKPDIVITKAARLDDVDIADIENCGQTWWEIVDRYGDYVYRDDTLLGNLRTLLTKMGAPAIVVENI